MVTPASAVSWPVARSRAKAIPGSQSRVFQRRPRGLPLAAAATGKPRGLLWKDCQWENGVDFVRERKTGQIAALVGVTIRFEAVADGDMEGLPAVGNLRNASAVFFFERGQWHTVGKAVFNMNPDEALGHFQGQYEWIRS